MNKDEINKERGCSKMNTGKIIDTTPKVKRISKEKRDKVYKKLTRKNKDIYERLAK